MLRCQKEEPSILSYAPPCVSTWAHTLAVWDKLYFGATYLGIVIDCFQLVIDITVKTQFVFGCLKLGKIETDSWMRHLSLDSGKTTLALEPYYWTILEYLADEDGYSHWRDWFYCHVLPDFKGDVSLASHTRLTVTTALVQDLETMKDKYDPVRKQWNQMEAIGGQWWN